MNLPTTIATGIVHEGQFIPLAWSGTHTEVDTANVIEWESMEGLTTVFSKPQVTRRWKFEGEVPYSWALACELVRTGFIGPAPFWLYSARAARLNLLRGGFLGVPSTVLLDSGLPLSAHTGMRLTCPESTVRPGSIVTMSILVAGQGVASTDFYSAAGQRLGGIRVPFSSAAVSRIAATGKVPEKAAYAILLVDAPAGVTATAPQLVEGVSSGAVRPPAGFGKVEFSWGERQWDFLAQTDPDDDVVKISLEAREVTDDA